MPGTIIRLLRRNLHDVFGENDPQRRRTAIAEIFADDAVFHAPDGSYRGRDAIDRVAAEIRATHPDFRYTATGPADELRDSGDPLVRSEAVLDLGGTHVFIPVLIILVLGPTKIRLPPGAQRPRSWVRCQPSMTRRAFPLPSSNNHR